MMIVGDGRYARTECNDRSMRAVDYMCQQLSGVGAVMAAAAACMARRFPGAIFRPNSISTGTSLTHAKDPVAAMNALVAIAAAMPEDLENLYDDRGTINIVTRTREVGNQAIIPITLAAKKFKNDELATIVDEMACRSEKYCVMGVHPKFDDIPDLLEKVKAAIGNDAMKAEVDFSIVISTDDGVEMRDVVMRIDL